MIPARSPKAVTRVLQDTMLAEFLTPTPVPDEDAVALGTVAALVPVPLELEPEPELVPDPPLTGMLIGLPAS